MSRSSIYIDGNQAGKTLVGLKREYRLLNKEIGQLVPGTDDYNRKLPELTKKNAILQQHRKNIKGIESSFGAAKTQLKSMLSQYGPTTLAIGVLGGTIRGVVSAFNSWFDNNVRFKRGLSTLRSLTGLGAESMSFLGKEAIRMGSNTNQSATDVLAAMKMIGSQRPELLKNAKALAKVTEETIVLAEAGEVTMEKSSKTVTGIQNQFKLAADQTKRIVNAVAAGSKAGGANIEEIGDTIKEAGAVSEGYNVSLEQTIGLTEALAEKEIKRSEAGTKLRNIMIKMQTLDVAPKAALEGLEKYNVNISKVTDSSIPFIDRLNEVGKITGDVGLMTQVFGLQNVVAAKAILENTDRVEHFTEAVTGTNIAYEQQAINNDNLQGDLKSLSSAWEGFTLTVGGGEIFRPFIQSGAELLNWTSESITAIREWDIDKMENQFLKFASSITSSIPLLQRMIDKQLKINKITTEVIDNIKSQADSGVVLTNSLYGINAALKNQNLTEEKTIQLKKKQSIIMDTLKEKYPQLTKEIDLQTASSKDLANLQDDINENLIEQALNAAKAAEQQRLINEIVQKRIALNLQSKKELKGFSLDLLSDARNDKLSMHIKGEINDLKRELDELPNVIDEVSETLNEMDLDFGAEFKENAKNAHDSILKIEKLNKLLKSDKINDTLRGRLETRLRTEKQFLKIAQSEILEMQKAATLETEKAQEEAAKKTAEAKAKAEAEAEAAKEEAEKRAKSAAKKEKTRLNGLQKELEDLIRTASKFKDEYDYSEKLKAFQDEQEKELFELDNSIEKKYSAEIEAAKKISKEKGEIGIKAQEQLNALLAIKEQDLSTQRLAINTRYADEQKQRERDAQRSKNEQYLEQQSNFEQSIVDLKLAQAQIAVDESADLSKTAQKAAQKELEEALIKQAEREKRIKQEALLDELDQDKINRATYRNRKEQLDAEHLSRITELHKDANDKIVQIDQERLAQIAESISSVVSIIDDLAEASSQKKINQIDREEKSELDRLNAQFKNKEISLKQFNDKKETLEAAADQKRGEIEQKQAGQKKIMAGFEIAINTAVQAAKVAANPVLVGLAIATGLAQAAIVAAAPVPQFVEGGFTEVIGADDGKTYNAQNIGRPKAGLTPPNPSLALISEKGPEYFVPNRLLRDQRVINYVGAIEAIRTNQYAKGGFTKPSETGGSSSGFEQLLIANIALLQKLNIKIDDLRVQFPDQDIERLIERIDEIKKFVA